MREDKDGFYHETIGDMFRNLSRGDMAYLTVGGFTVFSGAITLGLIAASLQEEHKTPEKPPIVIERTASETPKVGQHAPAP